MEIATNNTPKFIIYIAVFVFGFMVYSLTDANYQIMLRITQEKMIGEQDPTLLKDSTDTIYMKAKYSEIKRLFNTFSILERIKAMIKALGYSLASLLIIAFYRNYIIKIMFVVLDAGIIFIYLNKGFYVWWLYGSYIYSIYSGLILFFVGLMATTIIKEHMNKKTNIQNEPEITRLIQPVQNQISILSNKIEEFISIKAKPLRKYNKNVQSEKLKFD